MSKNVVSKNKANYNLKFLVHKQKLSRNYQYYKSFYLTSVLILKKNKPCLNRVKPRFCNF